MSEQGTIGGTRADLVADVARLCDLSLGAEIDAATVAELRETLRPALALLDAAPMREPWWRDDDAGIAFAARSPFTGDENARSPHMTITHEPASAEQAAQTVGSVRLGPAFAGPPRTVHGGIIAGLLDEVVGAAASAHHPGSFMVTGTLSVRYRRPTPIDTDLRLVASVTRSAGSRCRVDAHCTVAGEDEATVTARALLIARRR